MSCSGQIGRTTELLAVAGLILCMGCAPAQDRMLGSGQTSPLAGEWEGPVTGQVRWTARGLVLPAEGAPSQIAEIGIRSDGSFDLNRTMLAAVGDLSGLRKTGDQVHIPALWEGQSTGTFRVVWCCYTPTVSQVVIECRPDKAATGQDVEGASAFSGDGLLCYSARLNEDGTLGYHHGIMVPPTEESAVVCGLLKRVPPDPSREELIRQIIRDTPLPDHVIAERVERRRVETEAGNEFFLITPRGKSTQLPLVVVLPKDYEFIDAEYQAQLWRHQVDNLKIAVAIPILGDPRLGAFSQDQNWALGKELAEKVVNITPAAEEAVKPTGTYLLAPGHGVLVGHVLWQADNSQFDAFLATEWAWSRREEEKRPAPEPEAKVDKAKPVYFFWMEPRGTGFRSTPAAAHWYREHGFQDLFTVTTEVTGVDKHRDYMAAVLIGQTPDQVTVRRVTEDSPAPIPPLP